MTVRYRTAVAIGMLALGGINLVLVMILVGMGADAPVGSLVAGGACTLIGIMYLTRPYFHFETDANGGGSFEVVALIGPVRRTWEFSSPEDLVYQDGKFYVTNEGKRRKVGVSKLFSRPDDWSTLLARVQAEHLS